MHVPAPVQIRLDSSRAYWFKACVVHCNVGHGNVIVGNGVADNNNPIWRFNGMYNNILPYQTKNHYRTVVRWA